jgi:hypothetical protein
LERLATVATATIAVVGVTIYGILVLAYSEFFQELGINPADVGLEYGKTLGGAAGLTVLAFISGALIWALVYGAVFLTYAALRRARRARPSRSQSSDERSSDERWWTRPASLATIAAPTLTLVGALLLLHNIADMYADRVKDGRRIEPFRIGPPVLDIELLALRAEPAIVQPVDNGLPTIPPSSGSAENDETPMLYIGQAKGVAVLYNPDEQQVVYVPTSAALVTTLNCETRRAQNQPLCRAAS